MATAVSEVSSAVIDERRSQQLMERAMNLAERNELASAVLACRQAIALSPQASQSYSMLGLLLERVGDASGAVAAYEKVLELAPDSFLERESLSRLRGAASQRRNAREMFAFDDDELFGKASSDSLPTVSSPGKRSTPSAKTAVEITTNGAATGTSTNGAGTSTNGAGTSTNGAAHITSEASKSVATPAKSSATNGAAAALSATPNASAKPGFANGNHAATAPRTSTMPFPSTQSPRAPKPGIGVPLDLPVPASRLAKQSAWQRLKLRPTPYFRGVPLAGAAAIGLIFLLWANNYAASSRTGDSLPDASFVAENPFDNPAPEAPKTNTSPANPALTSQPAASNPVPTNSTNTTTAPAASGVTAKPGAPVASDVTANPAPTAPANNAPNAVASTPSVPMPAPAPADTPSGAPTDNGGASANGNPLGPTDAPPRDYARVTPSGGTPVARPENRAATDERNARTDAMAGRSNAAIDNLSRAIETGGPDVALRYQQRAQLYLQGNDGSRASSDFQAAISAYNDMIARGDRVAVARSGIAACRRGLQMAQARR